MVRWLVARALHGHQPVLVEGVAARLLDGEADGLALGAFALGHDVLHDLLKLVELAILVGAEQADAVIDADRGTAGNELPRVHRTHWNFYEDKAFGEI